MDRIAGGSAHWEQYTRVVHEIMITVTDDMLTSISEGDDVSILLQGREGAVSMKLSPNQARRLLFGDPRNRRKEVE